MRRLLVAILGVLTFAPLVLAAPVDARPGGPRIRPQDARTARFLEQGVKRSLTLRALVARIEASDVIVYVGIDPLIKSHLAGSLRFMSLGGDYRYVRAAISRDQSTDSTIATLAHEFRHVIEVIEDTTVIDDQSLLALYRRIGTATKERLISSWETTAAQETGWQVRRELITGRANAVSHVATVDASDQRDYSRDL